MPFPRGECRGVQGCGPIKVHATQDLATVQGTTGPQTALCPQGFS